MVSTQGHLTTTCENLEDILNDPLISSALVKGEPHTGDELMALLLKLPFNLMGMQQRQDFLRDINYHQPYT